MRRSVILAAAMGAMLFAAAPAEVVEPDEAAESALDEGTGPGFRHPTRDDCLRGGWMADEFPFRNQGECMRLANESRRLNRP